jgi:hypothetical protein
MEAMPFSMKKLLIGKFLETLERASIVRSARKKRKILDLPFSDCSSSHTLSPHHCFEFCILIPISKLRLETFI